MRVDCWPLKQQIAALGGVAIGALRHICTKAPWWGLELGCFIQTTYWAGCWVALAWGLS